MSVWSRRCVSDREAESYKNIEYPLASKGTRAHRLANKWRPDVFHAQGLDISQRKLFAGTLFVTCVYTCMYIVIYICDKYAQGPFAQRYHARSTSSTSSVRCMING